VLEKMLGKTRADSELSAFIAHLDENPLVIDASERIENYYQNGITLQFEPSNSVLLRIVLQSGMCEGYSRYKGELPFELTFDDDRATVRKKIPRPCDSRKFKFDTDVITDSYDAPSSFVLCEFDLAERIRKVIVGLQRLLLRA
jgi:hypothetical protein